MSKAKRAMCANDGCLEPLPAGAPAHQKYCGHRCQQRANQRAYRRRKAAEKQGKPVVEALEKPLNSDVTQEWIETAARRGPLFEKLMSEENREPVLEPLLRGEITQAVAAELLGCSESAVNRMLVALRQDILTENAASVFALDADAARLLGSRLDEIDPESDGFEEALDDLTNAFVEWRARYMTDERGHPYITKPFHRKWIRAILEAIYTGARRMILSPPRHGKTQLLIDFCTWNIVRDPHFRIIWVAANSDLAEDWLQAVQEQLEMNDKLRQDYLVPGSDWKPPTRSGKSWSRKQFKVGTRTRVVKSPTMQAVGRSGRILSRDVDFMIVDDIEDHGSTTQPKTREETRKWFAQDTGSRKEDHTSVVVIGSRQHPDDLYGHLLDNPEWDCIVEEAHDSACDLDPHDEPLHTECMLFPEKRSYAWFKSQERSFGITGGESLFLMVYQNVAIADGLIIFNPDSLKACRSERHLGHVPPGTALVAGLDPAYVGYQAAVLWAFQKSTGRYFLVDADNSRGAGIPGWRDILKLWLEKYNLRHWVVEDMAAQKGYIDDAWIRDFQASNGIHIEGHQTQGNKWDPYIGVTAMARLFDEKVEVTNPTTSMVDVARRMDLPYGTPDSKAMVDAYIAQALHFSANATQARNTRRGYKSDLVMASWFPMKAIRRWRKEFEAEVVFDYEPTFGGLGTTDWNEPPWGRMSSGR
jgi:hypothetical protein